MRIENLLNHSKFVTLRNKLHIDDKKLSLLVVLFLAAALYVDVQFVMRLQFNALREIQPKIGELKADLEALDKGLNIMQDLKSRPSQGASAGLQAPKTKKLVIEDQISSLYQDISEKANKNNVRIVLMRPSKKSPSSKTPRATATENFIQLSLALDLICGYHNLAYFIKDLEEAQTLLFVENIKISSGSSHSSTQKVDLVLKTYVQK